MSKSKADFIVPLYEFCKSNGFSFTIRYSEIEDMFYDLEIDTFPQGKFFYQKRPCYFNEELGEKVIQALENPKSYYAIRYDDNGKHIKPEDR